MAGRVDYESGASVVISEPHSKIHDGHCFIASYKTPDASPLADNEALDILIITGNVTDIHFTNSVTGNNDLEVLFYENVVVSNNGTSIPIVGLNRARTLPDTTAIYRSPTVTNVGNLLFNDFRAWGINPENFTDYVWVLPQNTNYLIRIINRAGAAQPASVVLQWYMDGAR